MRVLVQQHIAQLGFGVVPVRQDDSLVQHAHAERGFDIQSRVAMYRDLASGLPLDLLQQGIGSLVPRCSVMRHAVYRFAVLPDIAKKQLAESQQPCGAQNKHKRLVRQHIPLPRQQIVDVRINNTVRCNQRMRKFQRQKQPHRAEQVQQYHGQNAEMLLEPRMPQQVDGYDQQAAPQ